MRKLILTALLPLALCAQFRSNQIRIIPTTDGTAVGQIEFDTTRADNKAIVLKAPNTATASYTLTLPTAKAANNGDCLVSTTAGVLSFATCTGTGGGVWTASGSDVYRSTGSVTVGSATPDAKFGVVASINDGISVTDGTTRGIVFASSAATNSLVVGTTTNHPVLFFANNAEALRLSPGGALLTRGHILTNAPSASDIGDATNFFQTVYAENGDFTAGSVANQYLKARKLEIADIAGSGGFWDHRSQGSFVSNSSYTIRDNGGSRWIVATRAVSGSAQNRTNLFTDLIPSLRATADGDAVNDSTLPASGASGSRWSKTWTLDLDASGTVKLGTTSAVGQVWTASDTSGNGGWATPTVGVPTSRTISTTSPLTGGGDLTANRTLACPTCFLTSGGTINGGINAGITVTDGTATGILFASGVATNSIVAGTTSAHPFVLFGHNGERARLTATGMTVTGTLGVSGITTLSGDLRFGADNTQAIGQTGTRPSVVFSRIDNTRKLEISDTSGGGGFWDVAGSASMAGSAILTHRDPAGSRWAVVSRAESGTAANRTNLFTDLIPSLRSTGAGDAVTDTNRPSLGASGSEWTNIHGVNIIATSISGNLTAATTNTKKVQPDANLTHDLGDPTRNYNVTWTRFVEMASGGYIAPQTTNTSSIGRSGFPFNKGWFTDLDASGTVKLGTTSTVGHVWTATDTAGNGTWSAASVGVPTSRTISTTAPLGGGGDLTANRTLTCTTCFTTAGGSIAGPLSVNNGTNGGVTITDGTATGIMFASSALTNSIVFGTTSAHPLAVFVGNALHTAFFPSGNTCIGCTNNSNRLEVAGNTLVSGNLSFTGTLNTSISTTELGFLDGVTSAIQTQLNDRVTLGTTQTISGAKTFSTNAVVADVGFRSIGSSTSYSASRKLEVHVDGTGSNFFYWQSPSSNVLTLFNPAGSAAQTWDIALSRMTLHGDIYPGGTSGTRELGASAARFNNAWITNLNISGTVTGNIVPASSNTLGTSGAPWTAFIGLATVTSAIDPAVNGGAELGESGKRWSTVWTQALDASGTVKLGTSSTVGQVWTATDTSGNGTWGAAGVTATRTISTSAPLSGGGDLSANRTLSCPTCYTTGGGTISGAVQVDGSLTPLVTTTYNFGSSARRWTTLWAQTLNVSSGTVAPDGNNGISATVTVRNAAGTGSCTLVFSGGLLTGGTC